LLSSLVLCFPRQLASVFFVHPLYMGVSIKKPTLNGRMNSTASNTPRSWRGVIYSRVLTAASGITLPDLTAKAWKY
ncbi:MAG: hypothetical protein LBI35_05470, partial [Burkholderiales bacterium]|nr:hypothetical protein [Burkholderiales bacterium]